MNQQIVKDKPPQRVFRYFEELSAIPRGSGKTQRARAYCAEVAARLGLCHIEDEGGNIIIFKNGSPGREQEEPVILQGHLDMVWEKSPGSDFDFENCGLRLQTDGEYLFAKGTTLGGDDGIGVAMGLALLESETVSHPPLEVIFTADEEVGMTGAVALDVSAIKGKRMLNLDSEDEGVLWVSCAGGARAHITLPVTRKKTEGTCYSLTIGGLHGGHSGAEIHRGYANATKETGRLLEALSDFDFRLITLTGGTMDNAITRECTAMLLVQGDEKAFENAVARQGAILQKERENIEQMQITFTKAVCSDCPMDKASTQRVTNLLAQMPFGVQAMSKTVEGLVETSLNLGIAATEKECFSLTISLRSCVDGERKKLAEKVKATAEKYGGDCTFAGEYPAWEYKENSALQQVFRDCYRKMTGEEMQVKAIHAGLECGIFCGKIKGLDCVSLGPEILDIHTPQERMNLASCNRIWELLTEVLKAI